MNKTIATIDVFPLKVSPVKGILIFLFILFLAYLVFLLTNSLIFTLCAVLFLVYDLHSFFFPTKYIVFNNKIEKKTIFGKKVFSFEKVKKVINCRNGVLLSPYAYKTVLEKFRGLYIMCFDNEQKEELLSFFKEKIH